MISSEVSHNSKNNNLSADNRHRGCSDVICLIVFIVCMLAYVCVALFAYATGNPALISSPINSDMQRCGLDDSVKSRPNLLIFDYSRCFAKTFPVDGDEFSPLFDLANCPTSQSICVDKCPSRDWFWLKSGWPINNLNDDEDTADAYNDERDGRTLYCRDGFDSSEKLDQISQFEVFTGSTAQCAAYTFKSRPVFKRCLPTFLLDAVDALSSPNKRKSLISKANNSGIDKIVRGIESLRFKSVFFALTLDLNSVWPSLLVFVLISIVISCLYVILIRYFAGAMVWITAAACLTLLAVISIVCFYKYGQISGKQPAILQHAADFMDNAMNSTQFSEAAKHADNTFARITTFRTNFVWFDRMMADPDFWLALAIVFGVVFVAGLVILVWLIPRIRLAVQLMCEASRAVASSWSCIAVPCLVFPVCVLVCLFGASVFLYLTSINFQRRPSLNLTHLYNDAREFFDPIYSAASSAAASSSSSEQLISRAQHAYKEHSKRWLIVLHLYNLFCSLWLFNLALALKYFVLAAAFATWYWTSTPLKQPSATARHSFPVCHAVRLAFRHHLGSLAFGAFILAAVQLIRACLTRLESRVNTSHSPLAKFLVKCLKCCFHCLNKFLKFLTKNAYIMMAIRGGSLCGSARAAFSLLLRNVARVATLNSVCAFVMWLGKLVITLFVLFVAAAYYSGRLIEWWPDAPRPPDLNYAWLPIGLTGLFAFVIAKLFLDVFEICVDTLFLCAMQDLDEHDGSAAKPYAMSKNLMRVLNVKNETSNKNEPAASEMR